MRMTTGSVLIVGLLLAVGTGANVASAEERKSERPFEIVLGTGFLASGGAGEDLQGAMRGAGFNASLPLCWDLLFGRDCPAGSPIGHYPDHIGGGLDTSLSASFALKPRLAVRLEFVHANLGTAHGLDNDGNFLDIDERVDSFAVLATYDLNPHVRVGVGPLLYNATLEADLAENGQTHARRMGLMFEAGLRSSATRRIFLDLNAQYALVPSADVGPYSTGGFGGSRPSTVPTTHVHLGGLRMGAGLGVRF